MGLIKYDWDDCCHGLLPLAVGAIFVSIGFFIDGLFNCWLAASSSRFDVFLIFAWVVDVLLLVIGILIIVGLAMRKLALTHWAGVGVQIGAIICFLGLIIQWATWLIGKKQGNVSLPSGTIQIVFTVIRVLALLLAVWGFSLLASSETLLEMSKDPWKLRGGDKPPAAAATSPSPAAAPKASPKRAAALGKAPSPQEVEIDDDEEEADEYVSSEEV